MGTADEFEDVYADVGNPDSGLLQMVRFSSVLMLGRCRDSLPARGP